MHDGEHPVSFADVGRVVGPPAHVRRVVIKFPKPFLAVQVDRTEIVIMMRAVTGVELVKFPNRTKGSWDEWPAPLRLYLAF
jgi:hypothetical protein